MTSDPNFKQKHSTSNLKTACCPLPSDYPPIIQPATTSFSAGEFHQQPALSDNTVQV